MIISSDRTTRQNLSHARNPVFYDGTPPADHDVSGRLVVAQHACCTATVARDVQTGGSGRGLVEVWLIMRVRDETSQHSFMFGLWKASSQMEMD